MKFTHYILLIVLMCSRVHASEKADMLIFSFDRPAQLYAFLESIDTYVTGLNQLSVLYRSSTVEYDVAYEICFDAFKHLNIILIKQGADPRSDFKDLTLKWLASTTQEFILFGVDDIIVKDYINVSECIEHLQKTNAHGFYLRLGKNITQCYTEGIETPVPPHQEVAPGVYSFIFQDGKGDWGYPSSVDMTIFWASEVKAIVPELYFHTPNSFEGAWAVRALGLLGWYPRDMHKTGLCYAESKMVNIPLNLVQMEYLASKNMGYPAWLLQKKFMAGLKLDIKKYYQISNKAAHMEMVPTFITR